MRVLADSALSWSAGRLATPETQTHWAYNAHGAEMKCYVESDGRIYLVRRDGLLDLPTPDEVPFSFDRVAPLLIGGEETWFCVPHLTEHPSHWPSKDEVDGLSDVAASVRVAVHATMPRVVVEGLCIEGETILLVKGSRGLNDGRWSLPGGFLRFGETPEDGVLREIREEVGAEARILRFAGVHGRLGQKTGLHWVMLFYRTALLGPPRPDPDEIAEARYVPLREAPGMLHDPAMAEVVRQEAGRS